MSDDLTSVRRFANTVVRPAIYGHRSALDVAAHHLHGEPVPAAEALRRPFEPFAVGDRWGGRWDTTWFRFRGSIPPGWAGTEVVALVHLGGDEMVGFTAEGQIWDTGAHPVQGLHHRQREFVLTTRATGAETVEFFVEAAANPVPPWLLADWPLLMPDYRGEAMYALETAELAVARRDVQALYLDMRVLIELVPLHPDRSDPIIRGLLDASEAFDPDNVAATTAVARAVLHPELARPSSSVHGVVAVGHAHIDCAWLWPVRETKRKCARTFSNQLGLLERYPEHRFACSQAAQYQWMKDGYPDLYRRITQQVRAGRWEPVGGMWVEPDTNVPSGESLVRQLVYGKRFFEDEFGIETHELWIPDVFGYSAALPQIARQAGVTSLITQKMSWNDTNPFPHTTFWWEGHDGSRLLAHFPPADTYNGDFSAGEVAAGQDRGTGIDGAALNLYPYGYGDGGGGPDPVMIERYRRMADLDGLPRTAIGSVAEFLARLADTSEDLPTWVGELYLETHRATLTTHADVKLANRRGEEALRAAEMWSVAASIDRRPELEAAWKVLLLQQFHDILPGSSIHWVYEDTRSEHAEVLSVAGSVIAEAVGTLTGGGGSGRLVAFNPASSDRTEVVDLPDGTLAVVSAPACGWAPVGAGQQVGHPPVQMGDRWMDNGRLRVDWDDDGLLVSVRDLDADREVLATGSRGNLFQLHGDHPRAFDAWDVDRSYLDDVVDLVDVDSIATIEADPLRGGVHMVRTFGGSTISQTMRLAAGSRRLEFHTRVDWHERHRFLKVAFPVAVRSTRATYEIQHGHIERPTVANTSWDRARFEVCGHRWADLSEPGYGVALLNDCKYGYDIAGSTMRLSLLRGPGFPDPEADRGTHRFAYALLPHQGDLRSPGDVVAEAESFNIPISLVAGEGEGRVVTVDRPGVSIEAVKWADRSGGTGGSGQADAVVVRLCEVWGSRGPVRVTLHMPFTSVSRTDLLERDLEPLPTDWGTVELELRPFQLVTLKFVVG